MVLAPPFPRLLRFAISLYLVTASDIIPVLIPQIFFAIFSAVSTSFHVGGNKDSSISSLVLRLPAAVIWVWLQLLVLDLANQRLPHSVAEDKINKPWRPIPSRRITTDQAHCILLVSIVVTFLASLHFGGATEAMFLFTLNWMYNDLDLANRNWWLRNTMNALGITTIGAGATRVACGPGVELDQPALHGWWLLCAAMIATTIHGQDLYDQEGDAVRGRRTAPIVLGDTVARWTLIISVLAWSVMMPAYLGLSIRAQFVGYMFPTLLGLLMGSRLLLFRDVASDKLTFKVWAVWTVGLYALPMFHGYRWD